MCLPDLGDARAPNVPGSVPFSRRTWNSTVQDSGFSGTVQYVHYSLVLHVRARRNGVEAVVWDGLPQVSPLR